MFTPLVDLITYDPSLTEDFRCLFAYMPLAATQNFEGDISNWVIPAGKSLDCVAGCSGKYQNFASNAVKLQYGFAINISDWDISGITSLERAFAESNGFNSTQIANWAVPSTCTNLRKIFKQVGSAIASYGTSDSNIKNLDVSEWNTSRVQIWEQAFYETHWNGVGMNSLDFSGIYATGFDANTLYYSLGGAFTVRINTVALETFPAVPDWNFGGDAAVHYQQFPGLDNPFGDYIGWISGVVGQFPMNKTNWGTTLVGWANNADMTTNSNLYVANFGSGYNDFDYSGDAPVAAALTTLQNTKGWTLTGFTF
jgi:surface protein